MVAGRVCFAGALPFFTAFAIFPHANVSWDFGSLRAVLASPRFHRWHHTAAEEGRDKNFAGLLPLWIFCSALITCPRRSRCASASRRKSRPIFWVSFSGRSGPAAFLFRRAGEFGCNRQVGRAFN
jgi:hypothetical protein